MFVDDRNGEEGRILPTNNAARSGRAKCEDASASGVTLRRLGSSVSTRASRGRRVAVHVLYVGAPRAHLEALHVLTSALHVLYRRGAPRAHPLACGVHRRQRAGEADKVRGLIRHRKVLYVGLAIDETAQTVRA